MAQGVASAPAPQQRYASRAGRRNQDRSREAGRHRHTYGAIDLGTNNCRLLIARPTDGGFTVIDAFSRIVRLGEGLSQSAARCRTRRWTARSARCRSAPTSCGGATCRLSRSVATEACRRAANGREFADRVRDETGIVLDIIEPAEEARLAVLGCHKLLEPGDGPALIFDIGGGSTELVLIDQEEGTPRIRAWWSAPWGVVSLTESEGKEALEGPDRLAAYKRMRERARRAFANFATMLPESREGIRLLGTSGTVTTLASVHLALPSYDRRAVDGLHVPIEAMQKISSMIAGMDYEERSALALHRQRARRPGRRRLRDPRSDHRNLAGQEPRRRRPRHPRRDPAFADGARRLALVKRLKTAKGRKVSSTRWLERQLNDPYVKRAKAENYRSRAAYKLLELDERFGLLKGVKAVVDLGIAPGGWSQVVRRRSPQAKVVGIDLLPTDPIDGVTILQMDFMDEDAPERLKEALGGAGRPRPVRHGGQHRRPPADRSSADDGAGRGGPGVRARGASAGRRLCRQGARRRRRQPARCRAEAHFTTVKHAKPPASRKDSSEWYVVAQGFKGA